MDQKLVFIGNSIVNGFPFPRSGCFVSLIRQATGWDVINKGNNGETTTDILQRFDRDVIAHHPDLVCILTGTNDFIYRQASPRQAFENLERMVEKAAKAQPEAIRPVLLTPLLVDVPMATRLWRPESGIDYEAVNQDLEAIACLIRSSGIDYVDLTTAWQDCRLYHDGVHPLPEGHRFIADKILDFFMVSRQVD